MKSGARVMFTVIVTAVDSTLPSALLRRTRNIAPLSASGSTGVWIAHGLAQAEDVVLETSAQIPPVKRCNVSVTGPVPA